MQGQQLRRFREQLGLSMRAAAEQMGVTHVAMRNWENGIGEPPSAPYRERIERWSSGAIAAVGWGMTIRERREAAALASVRPATGTDG